MPSVTRRERTLADFGSKLSEDLRKRIETALRETREALSKRDATLASQKADALKVVLQEAGQTLYAQAPQPGPQPRPDVGAPTGEARPTGSVQAAAWSTPSTAKHPAGRDKARR